MGKSNRINNLKKILWDNLTSIQILIMKILKKSIIITGKRKQILIIKKQKLKTKLQNQEIIKKNNSIIYNNNNRTKNYSKDIQVEIMRIKIKKLMSKKN